MKITIKTLLVLGAFFITTSVSAQKFGYMNSQLILSELPAVKMANSNLESFQKQLQKKGQAMLQSLQAKYTALSEKKETGQISPVALEEQAALLKKEEEKIYAFEKKMQQDVIDKRTTLLQPIIDKVNVAVKSVAEQNDYQYIFDISTGGVLLYAEESLDITNQIKAKL